MVLATLVISIILVTFIMLALGIKTLIKKHDELPSHSCVLEEEKNLDKVEDCSQCELKDIVNCPEMRKNK